MVKKVLLIILDGWGIGPTWGGNAIALANTPNFDYLKNKYPYTTLYASGEDVGLPYGEPGNSEVGHLNIGSGQIVAQGLSAINDMIKNGDFYHNDALNNVIDAVLKKGSALHLMGLVSDGGIHSHIDHLFILLKLAKQKGLKKVYIHFFTDGRDSAVTSGIKYLRSLEEKIDEIGIGKVSTIAGRYYAMDRDCNWDRIERAYDAILGLSPKKRRSAKEIILHSYAEGITDEFLVPTSVSNSEGIKDNDSVIFFNYRSDRARQLTSALVKEEFNGFRRKKVLKNLSVATFGSYQENLPIQVAFESTLFSNSLASILEVNGFSHFHIAETEKYAHVTYFFNGGKEEKFPHETRVVLQSPKVKTFDLAPEMRAKDITSKVIETFDQFDFTVVNFANTDMVGHTGNFDAALKAVQCVDECLGKIYKKIQGRDDIVCIITADHGNAEEMIDQVTGFENTEHTKNPVPFILVNNSMIGKKLHQEGRLSDIVPTILHIIDIPKQKVFVGKNLLK